MSSFNMFRKDKSYSSALALITGVALAVGGSVWATSVGTNVTVTGALAVSSTSATSTLSTGGFTIGTSQFVVQQTSGNVGIGTTTPFTALALNSGQLTVPAGTAALPSYAFITDAASGLYLPAVSALGFNTAGAERVRINSSGNVGIGTTTPGTLFSVQGNSLVSGTSFFGSTLTASSTVLLATINGSTGGNVGIGTTTPTSFFSINPSGVVGGGPEFTIGSSTRTHFVVTNTGNVGIGTTTPFYTLSISTTTGTTTIELGTGNSTTNGSCIQMYTTSGAAVRMYATTTGTPAVFEAGSCSRLP